MQQTMEQMSNQLTEKWTELPKKQKMQIGVGAGAMLIALVVLIFLFARPKMTLLYNQNLESKQIAEVVEVLQEKKIPYEIVHSGMNIEVPEKEMNNAKIALATENVPKGNYTFADAINNTMSTTESEKQAKMQHLDEVELENMLTSMDDIAAADVKLVVPEEKNSFLASKQRSSASVVLTLERPQTTKQMEGIARLISSSVTNLDMNHINIMDTEGNTLYIGADEGLLTSNKQQELKLSAENDIKGKVSQLLEPMYDEIRISPNLILDFDHYEEVREEYIPQESGKGLPQKEVTQNTSATNAQNGAEPGVTNNGGDIPVYQIGNGTTGENKTSSKEVEYANNKVVSNAVKNVGSVDYKKSSLAVHVFKEKIYREDLVKKNLDTATTWEAFKETNKGNIAIPVDEMVLESIKNGTGIDNVVVYGYEKPVFIDQEPYTVDYKSLLPFVLIALIIVIAVLAMIKFRKHEDVVETEPELEVEEMLHVARNDLQLDEIELKETLETKRQIEKFVDEKPEAVASLLRNWLTEDDWE
ncbi:MAG: flagellar basal-body MS-ring/collar protein FliF [Cellulosilyticaceae bacterium]